MSSILKALKKLEHEKSARSPLSLKIDTDILRTVDSSRGFSPYSLALLFLLVFGGGAAVAFYFVRDAKAPREAVTAPPAPAAKALQAKVPPPVITTETLPAEIVVVPSGEAPRTMQKKTVGAVKAAKAAKAANRAPAKEAAAGVSELQNGSDDAAMGAAKGAVPAAADVTSLRVNGIAFQNSSADSMAIVNGIPVSSGSIIEGTAVEEIRKDRVLFQRNGEKFEIMLGQSNR